MEFTKSCYKALSIYVQKSWAKESGGEEGGWCMVANKVINRGLWVKDLYSKGVYQQVSTVAL